MDDHMQKLEEDSQTSTEIAATWNTSQEDLLVSIADRSNCFRWLHSKTQEIFETLNFYLTVPSIIVSTLAGSATIGLPALVPDAASAHYATIGIGLLTLSTGILTTINQYMKSPQLAEAHRSSAVAYGKLHRILSSELSLRRDQRLPAAEFIKLVRNEVDRLQDTSPTVLNSVVQRFKTEFSNNTLLEKPEITGDLDHVVVNRASRNGQNMTTPQHASITVDSPRITPKIL